MDFPTNFKQTNKIKILLLCVKYYYYNYYYLFIHWVQRFNFYGLSVGDDKWLTEATGVTDCFYNSSKLPSGSTIRFRVACVNKAGQGPYSNVSEGVSINVEGTEHVVELYLLLYFSKLVIVISFLFFGLYINPTSLLQWHHSITLQK